MVCYT